MLQMPHQRPRQYNPLEIAALLYKILYLITMRDADHILFDDGAVVKRFGDVVAGGADQFYTTMKCSMVGPRADKGRQEGMVHIDNARGIFLDELRRQDLHVASQHN